MALLYIHTLLYIVRRYDKFAPLYRYIRYYIYSASIYICAIIYMQALLYICTAKKATCFWPRYYPKPTGYVHVVLYWARARLD
jgi:hypothetical protein